MNNYYKITENTLAIISMGENKTHILEVNDEFYVNENAYKILDKNCCRYGSSYAGRCEGTKFLTGVAYKQPVVVEEDNSTVFFPTKSPKTRGCAWINLTNIKRIVKEKNKPIVKIIFHNGTNLTLRSSFYSIENQYKKATLLESVVKNKYFGEK